MQSTSSEMFSLTSSNITFDCGTYYSITGALASKVSGVCRVARSGNIHLSSQRGLTDATITDNITDVEPAVGTVTIYGRETRMGPHKHVYRFTFTAGNNPNMTLFFRDHSTAPPGEWMQGQETGILFVNNSGGAMGTVTLGATIKAISGGFVAPANGFQKLYTFLWIGTHMVCTGIGPDVAI